MIVRTFRAKWHNQIADLVRRYRPRYIRVPNQDWIHPWHTALSWDGEQWSAQVEPGFVNGLDPIVYGASASKENASLCDRIVIPLHGWRDGFAGISQGARQFFSVRGAKEPIGDKFTINVETASITMREEGVGESLESSRPLIACMLYLSIARPALASEIVVLDGSGLSGRVIDYQAHYETASLDRSGRRARLMQAPFMPQEPPVPTPLEIYLGMASADDGEDRIPVATLYLLGPEDAEPTKPDGTWTPYVQHHLFWNVMHALKMGESGKQPPPLRLATGLATADTIGNQMLSTINDLTAAIYSAQSAHVSEGQFFTI